MTDDSPTPLALAGYPPEHESSVRLVDDEEEPAPPSRTRQRVLRGIASVRAVVDGRVVEIPAEALEVVRRPRGFAAMTPEQRSAAGRKGGTRAQAKGTAHRITPETAREVGRKGGLAPHASRGRGLRGAFDGGTDA